MGQVLGGMWDRVQGKQQVLRICDTVFDHCAGQKKLLPLDKLHLAILLAYEAVNKHFPPPHKEAPTSAKVDAEIKAFRSQNKLYLSREDFLDLMINRLMRRDLRAYLAVKALMALTAAPALAVATRSAASRAQPRALRLAGEKIPVRIPTAALVPAYAAALMLLPDVRVNKNFRP